MSKTALITGGSSGLGFAMAKNLAGKGYTPVICARNRDRIDSATGELRSSGYEAHGFRCDVTDESSLRAVFEEVKQRFGTIDFLILNAGVVTCKLLEDFTDVNDLKRDLETDLWGTTISAKIGGVSVSSNASMTPEYRDVCSKRRNRGFVKRGCRRCTAP